MREDAGSLDAARDRIQTAIDNRGEPDLTTLAAQTHQ